MSKSDADPIKNQDMVNFKHDLFDIESGLIELRGTVGTWRRYALY